MPEEPPSTAPSSALRWFGMNAAAALAYVALAEFPALVFPGASPFWPPAALAAFVALRWGWGPMFGVFAGSLAANIIGSRLGVGAALIASAGNALAPMLGRSLMRRMGGSAADWWESPSGVLAFLLNMGVLQSTVSAAVGVGGIALLGHMGAGAIDAFIGWAIGDASAIIMLAPLLQIVWTRRAAPEARRPLGPRVHIIGVFVLAGAIWALAATSHGLAPAQRTGMLGLLLFPLTWSVFALDVAVTAGLLAFTFILLTGSAALGVPIVATASSAQTIVGLEFFLLAVGGAVVFSSALQHARRSAIQRLEEQTALLDSLTKDQARTLVDQEGRFHAQIVRLSDLTTVLAAINQVIAQAQDDAGLLQRFCELVVSLQGIALAWIGRPDDAGNFAVLAKAGPATGYLDAITISATASSPLGRGPVGQVWRQQASIFVQDSQSHPSQSPWADRLQAFGLRATAGMPLFRNGKIWAVFNLYLTFAAGFDAPLQKVAEQIAADISIGLDRLDAVRKEREQSRVNAALLSNMTVGVHVMRYPERVFEHVNARLLEMARATGFGQLLAHAVADFYPEGDDDARIVVLARQVLEQGRGSMQDVPYRRLDGTSIMVDLSGVRLDFGDGVQRILWTQIDVTDRHRQAQQLRQATATRAALLSNTVAAIDMVRYPDRVIVEANKGFLEITGFSSPDEVIGKSTNFIYAQVAENQRMAELAQRILQTGEGKLEELEVQRSDGTLVYLDIHGRRLEGEDPEHPLIVWTSIDVTERRTLTQELRRLAMFDALTGLPNRRALETHVSRAISRARRHGSAVAVGMIDLDDFKPINDRLGHDAGDRLLQQLANRLRAAMRSIDFVGRFGGDEFVIVLEDLEQERIRPQLEQILGRIHEVVDTPFTLDDGPGVHVEMSLGIAIYPVDSDKPDALLRGADAAMYRAKNHKMGRAQWWVMGTSDSANLTEAPFDPFSDESQRNLAALAPRMSAIAADFSTAFYSELGKRDEESRVLGSLTPDELDGLKAIQAAHFQFLLEPSTRAHQIAASGAIVGRVHALSGINAATMSDAYALYRELLRWNLDALGMPTQVRYRTLRAADERLQIEMQAEFDAMQAVVNQYNGSLSRPTTSLATTVELVQHELDSIAGLAGILAVVVMRPQADGLVHAELAAGVQSAPVLEIVGDVALTPSLDAQVPTGQGLVRAAWVSGDIERIDSYGTDPRSLPWAPRLLPLGVRSMVAIPIQGLRSQFVLAILGAYRSQFAANWMQTFLASLQSRWIGMMSHPASRLEVTEPESVARYRELLYAKRLSMFVQPIIDTRSGEVVKVEALARLIGADEHDIVSPARFLPAMRSVDLDVLFRAGLEQSLSWLKRVRAEGRTLGVSLNLPPSTLVHPACAEWIGSELRRTALAPESLTLELLESQEFDDLSHDQAIRALEGLGVKLAIDDLGAGYSSLSRLASLPFDVIKVDQSITAEVLRAPLKVLSLIRTVVQIGADLDRDVVVEGAETRDVVQAVTILGAHYVQGYAISHPIAPEEFFAWERSQGEAWKLGGEVDSWLVALAYCWLHMHNETGRYPTTHALCPLTGFLERQGYADGEAAGWHAALHDGIMSASRREVQNKLLAWLVDRVQAESRRP